MDAYDYLVLTLIMSLSVLIGLYYAAEAKYGRIFNRLLRNKKKDEQRTSGNQMDQYLTAGGEMHFIPLAFSLLASNFSASGMLGYPGK
jgi:hypothetical protein